MELKEFVSETLSNIIQGIEKAQKELEGKDCAINPEMYHEDKDVAKDRRKIKNIEFEVLLKLEESQGSKATIGVFAGFIGGGAQGQSGEITQSLNKIKFSVPVVYPKQKGWEIPRDSNAGCDVGEILD